MTRRIAALLILATSLLAGCDMCWARPQLEQWCAAGDAEACIAMNACEATR